MSLSNQTLNRTFSAGRSLSPAVSAVEPALVPRRVVVIFSSNSSVGMAVVRSRRLSPATLQQKSRLSVAGHGRDAEKAPGTLKGSPGLSTQLPRAQSHLCADTPQYMDITL